MISAADFPDVFPYMAGSPTRGCIERWENEGGRALPQPAGGRPRTDEPTAFDGPAECFVPFLVLAVPALAVATLAIASASDASLPR